MPPNNDADTNNLVLVYISEYSAMRSEITQLSAKQQNLLIASFAVSGYAFTNLITSEMSKAGGSTSTAETTPSVSVSEIDSTPLHPNPSDTPEPSPTKHKGGKHVQSPPALVITQPTVTKTTTKPTNSPYGNQGNLWLLLCLVLCGLGFLFCDADRAIIRCATYIERHIREKLATLLGDTHVLEWERYIRGRSTVLEHDLPLFKRGPWNAAFQGSLIFLPALACFFLFGRSLEGNKMSPWVIMEFLSALVGLVVFFIRLYVIVLGQKIPFKEHHDH